MHLAFPYGIYPGVELLCNGYVHLSILLDVVFDIHVAAQNVPNTFPIAISFPHYLFKVEVLKNRCSHKRLQFRREHCDERDAVQNCVNEVDCVWPS